ncbi:uncharacterized protein LOC132546644 [Ylistrum balloti]|uniref:uncharacterized protein LOC132546644 n=1 Tax=Ylistrum balloti TaxID=509963 RepID=UPI002905DFA6|nr:uncharacterized protein LOC132546644 [Ylistrum balloti]
MELRNGSVLQYVISRQQSNKHLFGLGKQYNIVWRQTDMTKQEIICRFGIIVVVVALQAANYLEASYTYILHDYELSWIKAEERCEDDGMILLKINSQQELDQLHTLFGDNISERAIWTGLHTTTDNCSDYTWSDGVVATWYIWHPEEPDDCASAKCVRLYEGEMRTRRCKRTGSFICQTQKETTSTSTKTTPTEAETTTSSFTESTTTAKPETTSTSTTNTPTEAETSTISVTEATTTEQETTSRATDGSTNGTFGSGVGSEYTTSSLVDGTEFSTESIIGNITCLCDENSLNTTVGRRGIIPSSLAHQKNLLMSGYVPACLKNTEWGNGSTSLSREEKMELLNTLKKQLKLAKDTTSLSRRKLISAPDNRTSATSVGVIGICVLVALFGTIVLIDASTLYRYYKNTLEKLGMLLYCLVVL